MAQLFSNISNLSWQQAVMWLIGGILIYLAIKRDMEPALLLPMGFGAILVNLPSSGVLNQMVEGIGESQGIIQWLFETSIEASEALPLLLFIGIGAMIDFGPLLSNPKMLLFGAAAQFGIFFTMVAAVLLGFDLADAASIGIIGAADGPTAIYLTSMLAPELLGPIAVAAYSYMALVPVILWNDRKQGTGRPKGRERWLLWLGGALGLGLMEWNNPATLGGLSVPGKVMASLFQSVSTRTAGMNTVDLASCGTLSKLLMSVLQFIGAAPGSTGGGVKVTTFAVIILTIRSVAQGRDDCVIADHHIESKTVYRALTIIVLGAAAAIGSAIVVYYNTSDAVSVVDAIFESCSAFGTVGLSVGVTSQLNNGAKILYMLVMFMGRVGPVAFAMSLTAKPDDNKRKIMPVGHINVG